MSERVLVLGIGRPRFGDDAAGLDAAAVLCGRIQGIARVEPDDGGGWSVLHAAENVALLVLIDAAEASAGLPVGRWCRLRYPDDAGALLGSRLRGTHSAGVVDVLEMAVSLGRLPAETWIYAIAGDSFAPETGLSPPVAASMGDLIDAIESDVRGWLSVKGQG